MHIMSDRDTAGALFDEVERLRSEVARWGGLTEAIQQITGEPEGWPSHGNAPLAIAAKMQLMQIEVSRQREQAEALREALCGARAWVEKSTALIRPLSSLAAAPGDDMLREIDAALTLGAEP